MDTGTAPSGVLEELKLAGPVPKHVAIIMDGNGRWARARGLPRIRGHGAGMDAVRDVIIGAREAGIGELTLFAFSQENWNRPRAEVAALMRLLQRYVVRERDELRRQGVEVHVFGDHERLSDASRSALEEIERYTRGGRGLRLNLLISYGSRAEIVRAARNLARRVQEGRLDPDAIDEETFASELYMRESPDPDLLIRTSGEQRISNFLLWQLAYTELYITATLWPDFRREHLFAAILDFQKRERRFGKVTAS